MKQLPKLTSALLTTYPTLITLLDKDAQSAYHYAMKYYAPDVLSELIKHSGEFINETDSHGRTPLHLAMLENNIPAITQLSKASANVYLPDLTGTTPLSLAQKNTDHMKALCTLNTEHPRAAEVFPPLRRAKTEDIPALRIQFSALGIFEDHEVTTDSTAENVIERQSGGIPKYISSPSSTSSVDSPKSSSSSGKEKTDIKLFSSSKGPLTIDAITTGDVTLLESYLNEGGDPNVSLILGRPLILSAFLAATNNDDSKEDSIRNNQLEQFYLLLKHAKIDTFDRARNSIFNYATSPFQIEILRNAYFKLAPEATLSYKKVTQQIGTLETNFEVTLFNAGLQNTRCEPVKDIQTINFTADDDREVNLAKLLWDLCAGNQPSLKQRIFQKEYVSNMVQGLISSYAQYEILLMIRRLWPEFDLTQKLIALFIVKDMIVWDLYDQLSDKFTLQFSLLKKTVERDFPLHANQLNSSIENIDKLKKEWHILYGNCQKLFFRLLQHGMSKNLRSFQQLMHAAATTALHNDFELIVQEMRTMMLIIYLKLKVNELYNKSWSRDNKSALAPHIMMHAKLFDSLSDFIVDMILKAESVSDKTKILKLFITIAGELSKPKNGIGPDLSCVVAIVSALNSSEISRMKVCFASLDAETKSKYDCLVVLADPGNKFKNIRTLTPCYVTLIPHLGIMLSDVTFIYDGNTDLSKMFPLLGHQFKEFLQLQRELFAFLVFPQTSICAELLEYKPLSKEERELLSQRVESPTFPIDNLTFSELHSSLNDYLKKGMMPKIFLHDKRYESVEAIKPITEFIIKYLNNSPTATKKNFEEAKKLLSAIVTFVNHRYATNLNIVYFLQQLNTQVDVQKLKSDADSTSSASTSALQELAPTPTLLLSSVTKKSVTPPSSNRTSDSRSKIAPPGKK